MSIKVQWEDTTIGIIRMTFEPDWTLQAYYHSIAALDAMLHMYPGRAIVLMDMSAANTTPIMHLSRGREMNEDRVLCNTERLVVINPGHFMPSVSCPVDIVDTLEDAYTLLDLPFAVL
jgi:hypothetical protein